MLPINVSGIFQHRWTIRGIGGCDQLVLVIKGTQQTQLTIRTKMIPDSRWFIIAQLTINMDTTSRVPFVIWPINHTMLPRTAAVEMFLGVKDIFVAMLTSMLPLLPTHDRPLPTHFNFKTMGMALIKI